MLESKRTQLWKRSLSLMMKMWIGFKPYTIKSLEMRELQLSGQAFRTTTIGNPKGYSRLELGMKLTLLPRELLDFRVRTKEKPGCCELYPLNNGINVRLKRWAKFFTGWLFMGGLNPPDGSKVSWEHKRGVLFFPRREPGVCSIQFLQKECR